MAPWWNSVRMLRFAAHPDGYMGAPYGPPGELALRHGLPGAVRLVQRPGLEGSTLYGPP